MSTSNAASERWRILKSAILSARGKAGTNPTPNTAASVRSFVSYKLFNVSTIEPQDEGGPVWRSYSLQGQTKKPLGAALIRVPSQPTSLEDMIGFNNTGNVCIWPSEEVMAYYCLKHSEELFSGASVCELGSGMSGLAGVLLASTQLPKHVLVTDGNESSMENVASIISRNSEQFGRTTVHSCLLCWDDSFLSTSSAHDRTFDWVICGDCLFFTELHQALLRTILKLLRPKSGRVLVFAPRRGGTLEQFLEAAREWFCVESSEDYDDLVSRKHQSLRANELYKQDLHYPVMLMLRPLHTYTHQFDHRV